MQLKGKAYILLLQVTAEVSPLSNKPGKTTDKRVLHSW